MPARNHCGLRDKMRLVRPLESRAIQSLQSRATMKAQMNYQRMILVVLLVVAVSIPTTLHAAMDHAAVSSEIFNRPGLRTSDLRSAYLMRAGLVHYDSADHSAQSIQRQLRRHFDVVLAMLIAATPTSIETAINRLESTTGQHLSDAERQRLRGLLVMRRYAQLVRLKAYHDRGLFPQNEGPVRGETPIFVDQYDTACAVGHLMRLSGWESEVASIQATNNLVYVSNIAGGPVARWILTSGLTMEEAALIQPSYGWLPRPIRPPVPEDAINPVASNWSGVVGDLRFSNFKFLGPPGPDTPTVNISINHTVCGSWFCSTPIWPSIPLRPVGELKLNEDAFHPLQSLQSNDDTLRPFQSLDPIYLNPYAPDFEELSSVLIQFDVETVSPTQRLVKLPYASTLTTYPDEGVHYFRNEVGLFLSDDNLELFFHYEANDAEDINNFTYYTDEPIEAATKMTVVTELLLSGGQPYEAQRLHFDVITIPEPCAVLLLACGGALSCLRRWRLIR
jgi:hypothetical protein